MDYHWISIILLIVNLLSVNTNTNIFEYITLLESLNDDIISMYYTIILYANYKWWNYTINNNNITQYIH